MSRRRLGWFLGLGSIFGVVTSACAAPTDDVGATSGGPAGSGGSSGGSGGSAATGATGGKATGGASGGGQGGGSGAACSADHADCDADPDNGCETNTLTDAFNCGACGAMCKLSHSSAKCVAGACAIACLDSWGDCDGAQSNGCEAALTNPDNCGACGVKCAGAGPHSTGVCKAAACGSACDAGYADCTSDPGCETPVLSDSKNCGACGHDCAGHACNNGECEPEVIYSDVNASPFGLALSDAAVFWTDSYLDQVATAPKTGGSMTSIASSSAPGGIAVDGNDVIWASDTDEAVWKAPVTGGTKTKLADIPSGAISAGLAVSGATLYWLGGDTLRATPIAGGTTLTIAQADTPSSLSLVVDAGQAYWANPWNGDVVRAPLSGGAVSVLASASYPNDVDVDATNIYYGDDYGLWRVAKAGGTPTQLVTASGVYNVATDGTWVFYTDGSALYRVSASGGAAQTIHSVGSVGQLRLDKGWVYWTDAMSGSVLRVPK